MSTTIRRKKGQQPRWILYPWISGYDLEPRFPEEDRLAMLREHYRDNHRTNNNPSKWFRQNEQSKFKMFIRQELTKFLKDQDYEVQIRRKYLHDYWD